jgi:Protein of unknown function (DUF2946)
VLKWEIILFFDLPILSSALASVCNNYAMKRRKNFLKPKAWLAIFALLVQALLPGIAYASMQNGGGPQEICTAFGVKQTDSKESDSGGAARHKQQCPVCALAHLAGLPASEPVLALPAFTSFVVALSPAARVYRANRLLPHLRGPPSLI